MPSRAGLPSLLFSLLLLVPLACRGEDEGYAPGRVYVVETGDGGAYTSEIADSHGDSLYFVDGSAISKGEVTAVRRPGTWAEERTVHPGPETRPEAPALAAGSGVFLTLVEALVNLFIAILD